MGWNWRRGGQTVLGTLDYIYELLVINMVSISIGINANESNRGVYSDKYVSSDEVTGFI